MRLQSSILYDLAAAFRGKPHQRYVLFMDDESVSFDLDSPVAPTLTTQQQVNGAIVAFYPGVLDRLCRMAGGDVYVVFTSISDVHVHLAGAGYMDEESKDSAFFQENPAKHVLKIRKLSVIWGSVPARCKTTMFQMEDAACRAELS